MSKKHRRDTLTNLPVREQLEIDLRSAISVGEHVAIAVLDIDHFGEVNGRFGVEKGDQVITVLSEFLLLHFPGKAYRVSGDEFAVLLQGSNLEQAFLTMEGFRIAVYQSQEQFSFQKGDDYEVTIAVGVAQYPRDAKDTPSLIRAGNAALGNAKENGRNQVSLPPNEEMIMKSCYYPSTMLRQLKALSEKLKKKESVLLREALDDLLLKYDRVGENG